MQKPGRPKSLSRHLSERARAASGSDAAAEIAGPGGAAADILGRLKQVFDQVVQAAETAGAGDGAASGTASGEIPFTLGGSQGRVVFGYTMRMGLDGLQAEPFGDMPAPAQKPAGAAPRPAVRAPIVDVFEEAGTVRIVAELPGVAAEDVSCTLHGDALEIATRTPPRYGKTVRLPCAVDAASLVHRCSNGILEIRIDRAAA